MKWRPWQRCRGRTIFSAYLGAEAASAPPDWVVREGHASIERTPLQRSMALGEDIFA